ncbi:MAG TPA: CinA family protein [Intrasporangium sp.]|nr:CinA family protein [Intrasporangium sp.]
MTDEGSVSERIVTHLSAAGETVACAESLTAGLVSASIADTPGASVVLRGAIVAYAADVKVALLGVPASVVAGAGTVDPRVARAMAEGARLRLGATWGISTTGVAGPGPAEGKPEGTVHLAVAGPRGTVTRALRLKGTRDDVRRGAAAAALEFALDVMMDPATSGESPVPRDPAHDADGQTPAPS